VVDGFYARRKVWLAMFKDYDVVFKSSYLRGGSNYLRTHKIQQAFHLAGFNISLEKAEALKNKYHEA
jgi:hypothetical protein